MLTRIFVGRPTFRCGVRSFSVCQPRPNWAAKKTGAAQYGRRKKTAEQEQEEAEQKKVDEAIKSGSRWRKWGAIMSTRQWNKKVTKYYVMMYVAFLFYGYYHFQGMYRRESERKELLDKRDSEGGELSEWERLRVRELSGDLIRTTDSEKLKAYHALKDEHDAQIKACHGDKEQEAAIAPFDPQPQDIEAIVDRQMERSVLPPRDLSSFYDEKAAKYDKEVGREEFLMGMGLKRKWLMKHCSGDVLEVASGTGRNIKYLDLAKISSYTMLDPAEKMMDEAFKKFKEKWPDFARAKFVVGRAEDLLTMSSRPGKKGHVRYDTIIETFGLCSEEDPVQALKNMKELLKPGGRIVLLEHGRGTWGVVNNKLDTGAQRHSDVWGCRWNLDIGELVDRAGLEITTEKRGHAGTTWSIVCKRPGDVLEYEELGFLDKYFTTNRTKNLDSSVGPNDAFGRTKK